MAKTTTAPIDPLYEINEACERLKCSPPTLYRLDDDGEITLLKIRGKTLVAGVEALIARQLEAAELRRLAQEAGAAPPVACQITTEAPCGIVGQPPLQGRRGRKRQTEPPPDALLAAGWGRLMPARTDERDAPDNWGDRGRECAARRAEAGTPRGEAYAAYLQALPPAEAADEVRAIFTLCATGDLVGEIASDLQLDPEKAELIAWEIQAARQRVEHAARPFRHIATED